MNGDPHQVVMVKNQPIRNNNHPTRTVNQHPGYHRRKPTMFLKIIVLLVVMLSIVSLIGIGKKLLTNDQKDKQTEEKDDNISQNVNKDLNDPYKAFKTSKYYKEENKDRYMAHQKANTDLSPDKVVLYVNIGLDNKFYTNIQDSPNKNTNTVLVNKYYSLGEDYVPNDLELIDSAYQVGGKKMTHDATVAFNQMAKAAKEEGYNIRAMSTYRSYSYQDGLYNRYVQNDGVENADTYSARPGHSEHQTGLAVDVDNVKMTYTNFGNTNEFSWMKNNAYKYGYILRYTQENEFITGYKNEPWHYRYVGVEIATKMREENIMSYEEYYFMYLA